MPAGLKALTNDVSQTVCAPVSARCTWKGQRWLTWADAREAVYGELWM